MPNRSLFSRTVLTLSLFLLSGFCFDKNTYADEPKTRLTNPLLQYIKFRELRPFRTKIDSLLAKQKEKGDIEEAAVYFRSLADGIWIGINEKEKFHPASLLKIPIMLTYFRMAQNDPEVLDHKLEYKVKQPVEFVKGLADLTPAKAGQYYSVDELIYIMITASDNNAVALLTKNLPPGQLSRTYFDFGMNLNELSATSDFASLKIVASFVRVLYNASYLNEAMSEKALGYLTECSFRDGLVAGLSKNTAVAHKFGERYFLNSDKKELHEVAIVYYANNPYLLAVMTKGKDYGRMTAAIKEVSALIYNEVDSQCREPREDYTAVSQ